MRPRLAGYVATWPALRAGIGVSAARRQASLSKSTIEATNPFWPNLTGHFEVYPLQLAGSELSEYIQNIGVYFEDKPREFILIRHHQTLFTLLW